ncbi:Alkaline phosphatase D precursor [Planctomycetes bacterium Pan216]|uniref:Alkaline phosphatase D n=1 Tax=Kolteria novifilia TaxID=2527975 RepID=A0A518AXE3_9BACT|nr:Alkaline phosphatase D precursor [Planctomycetes bacterium Pan216]
MSTIPRQLVPTFTILLVIATASLRAETIADGTLAKEKVLSRIGFGSCVRQDQPQPIWNAIVAADPSLFVLLGDNVYGDTQDMSILRQQYDQLAANPGYRKLLATCPILATWDDHDYGANDAGKEFPSREQSKNELLRFLKEPSGSARWNRPGVYGSYLFGPADQRVQIILLDTRYFRDPLKRKEELPVSVRGRRGFYAPHEDRTMTILGEQQWAWLEKTLQVPARLRIVATSIQLISSEHGFETWGNFPAERERFFQLIKRTKANGVVLISGDRHHAELSQLKPGIGYPLFEVTSSSLNAPADWANDVNPHRLGSVYWQANFGMITIDWKQPDPTVALQIRNVSGQPVLEHAMPLSQLQVSPTSSSSRETK